MRTIREETRGKLTLRLVEDKGAYKGVVISAGGGRPTVIDGVGVEEVWERLQREAGKVDKSYIGFDGARARFLRFFPTAFSTPLYAKDERNYKLAAKAKLDSKVPMVEAATGSGFGEAVLSVYRATNLLAPIEKTKLQDLLRNSQADRFVRAVAQFALEPSAAALAELDKVLRPFDSAKWTVISYLPFLWQPRRHMFLKPTVTKEFATRVGHRFAQVYDPRLDLDIYKSLLELASATELELADFEPQDWIDVQSFIFVVGGYDDTAATGMA